MRIIQGLPVLLLVALASCAGGSVKPEVQAPVPTVVTNVKLVCLDLKQYTPEQEKKAAVELAALPPDDILTEMMIDYGDMRDRDRVCLKNQ